MGVECFCWFVGEYYFCVGCLCFGDCYVLCLVFGEFVDLLVFYFGEFECG